MSRSMGMSASLITILKERPIAPPEDAHPEVLLFLFTARPAFLKGPPRTRKTRSELRSTDPPGDRVVRVALSLHHLPDVERVLQLPEAAERTCRARACASVPVIQSSGRPLLGWRPSLGWSQVKVAGHSSFRPQEMHLWSAHGGRVSCAFCNGHPEVDLECTSNIGQAKKRPRVCQGFRIGGV